MKRNLMMIVLGAVLALGLTGLPAHGEEHNEGFEQRVHALELEARELELQNLRMSLESRELELQEQRMEIALMERRLDDDDDDDDNDDDDDDRRAHGKRGHDDHHCDGCWVICVIGIIAHILLAIWVQGDAKKRGTPYGIWLTLVLLTGFFGAITYALVRIGDINAGKAVKK
ncbi:MAG: hypothetical protein ACYTGQ_03355 [Planctomycetota bacterium]|jgi:hypothetical protein